MAKEVRLPQLGQTMEEGTVVNCLVKVGDEVKKGDVIFEIETDKATLEMESPAGGFVKHILVAVDETLLVGAPLLVLGGKDEQVSQSFVDSLKAGAPAAPAVETAPAAEPGPLEAEPGKPAGRVIASPRAKKLASDLGVDLSTLTGTGPGGKITEQDVQNAAGAKTPKPAAPPAPPAETQLGKTVPL
ncbi:MAG: biotin/lipoyl-containing protein, partial [Planctomycetota bacterium]